MCLAVPPSWAFSVAETPQDCRRPHPRVRPSLPHVVDQHRPGVRNRAQGLLPCTQQSQWLQCVGFTITDTTCSVAKSQRVTELR